MVVECVATNVQVPDIFAQNCDVVAVRLIPNSYNVEVEAAIVVVVTCGVPLALSLTQRQNAVPSATVS